jgi:hypothetical protein
VSGAQQSQRAKLHKLSTAVNTHERRSHDIFGIFFTVVPGKRKKRTAPQAPAGGREGMGREKEGIGRKKEGLDNPASARCAVARSGSLAMDYAPCGGVRRQCYALLLRDESLSELAPPLQASARKALCGAQRPGRGRACRQLMTRRSQLLTRLRRRMRRSLRSRAPSAAPARWRQIPGSTTGGISGCAEWHRRRRAAAAARGRAARPARARGDRGGLARLPSARRAASSVRPRHSAAADHAERERAAVRRVRGRHL